MIGDSNPEQRSAGSCVLRTQENVNINRHTLADSRATCAAASAGLWPGLICRLPKPLLVFPMVLQWLWLAARYRSVSQMSAANPAIEVGGLVGESKLAYFQQVRPAHQPWLARTVGIVAGPQAPEEAIGALGKLGLSFPVIAKPDIGWCGFGVRRLKDACALNDYIASYPVRETLLLQEYLDLPGEAGLFYVRWPGAAQGRVLSLTVREAACVVGDGSTSVGELVARDPILRERRHLYENLDRIPLAGETATLSTVWSHRMGGRYRDMSPAITPALEACIEAIAGGMPEFHIARFDVRFTTLAALGRGEFKIMEINGAGSEAINFFDRDVPFFSAYRGILAKTAMVFALADANRARGFAPCGWRSLLRAYIRQSGLLHRYPAAN
ncbi:hypothetical protein BH11PSE3_BH11PSE3_16410 [soil metagenome]